MAESGDVGRWSNWAGDVTAHPSSVVSPASTQEMVELLGRAAADGTKVRPVGSGHSFTAVAKPVDVQVKLDRMRGLISVDQDTARVRIKAGTTLFELCEALHAHGLALPNMGDIDQQTISGAVSTSTHGTGAAWTGFGGAVVGGELVTGTGEVLRWGKDENTDLAPALGVTLGALGVLTEVEMQCVPAFMVRAVEAPSTLTETLGDLSGTLAETDHFEFYWFPHTDKVMTKRNTRLPGDAATSPLPRWKFAWEDEFLSNTVFEAVNRLCVARPSWTKRVNRVSASTLSAREYTDRSYKVYASPRTVKFRESEMAVPADAAESILRELQRWVERNDEPVAFPVEVRWTAPDDRWMSTAYERPSCYIAVHHYVRQDHRRYFESFWDIAKAHDARPHWGKMHDFDAEYLRGVYPRFDDFLELRARFDPRRVLTNPYLDRVLGA